MVRPIPIALAYACLAAIAPGAYPQDVPAGAALAVTSADLASVIDPLVERQVTSSRIAGALVVVVYEGAVVHAKGYGLADVARKRPMEPDTVVRLASVSKLFTAIAVMQLVAAGRLDLDRNINDYLDFAIPRKPRRAGHVETSAQSSKRLRVPHWRHRLSLRRARAVR